MEKTKDFSSLIKRGNLGKGMLVSEIAPIAPKQQPKKNKNYIFKIRMSFLKAKGFI
jgi:hypothetical protein